MLPLKVGNYWIYQQGYDDTLGITHSSNNFDSVYVQNDTVISGVAYYKIGHANNGFQNTYYYNFAGSDTYIYLKESFGDLVSLNGFRLFDHINLHDTIHRDIYSPSEYSCIVPNTFIQKHFLIGQYSGSSMDLVYYRNTPGFKTIDTAGSTFFVKNLGIIKSYYSFSSCLRNCRYSYNLIRYHLN